MAEFPKIKNFGFGSMRLPLLNPDDRTSIDIEQVKQMVDRFLEQGFTYFDTAYSYHNQTSELALRDALTSRYDRSKYLIADKMPTFLVKSPEDYPRFFQEQLDRLQVDYIDFYMLHNLGTERYKESMEFGGFEFIKKVKEQGKARFIGISYHDNAKLLDEILTAHPYLDFVQLQINYFDWESASIQSRLCYEVCQKHGMKVLVMEPIKGGGLASVPAEVETLFRSVHPDASPASWALRFCGSLDDVYVVLSGMSSLAQAEENCAIMRDFAPLNVEERATLDKATELLNGVSSIRCTGCQYCTDGCPKQINIPALFSIYNVLQQFGNNNNTIPMHYERHTTGRGLVTDCIACGQCEGHCPQHLPIIEDLKMVAEAFRKVGIEK